MNAPRPIGRRLAVALRRLACRVGIHSTLWHRDRYDDVAVRVCWRCGVELERCLLSPTTKAALEHDAAYSAR